MTKSQIKADLKEIKFYYHNKVAMDNLAESMGEILVLETVKKYNDAVCKAPCKLIKLYADVYHNGKTIIAVAQENSYSVDFIEKTHLKLIRFFLEYFNQEVCNV